MRILVVGDWYMPPRYFAQAFATLDGAHQIAYREIDSRRAFRPASASERRLREHFGSPAELVEQMAGVEVLVVHGAPVSDAVLDAGDALGLVCCARGGPVNVDVEAMNARGLPLVTTPGKNAEAVADLTIALLIMLARGLRSAQRYLDRGGRLQDNFTGGRFMGRDLRGHTLGLVGYGQVGRRVARRAQAFGLRVVVYDPYTAVDDPRAVRVGTLAELLRESDFVSLHARATPDNHAMIDAAALAEMRPGALLVNTARESLVDEQALDAALSGGRLGGAALDVFAPDTRLGRHENVVLTPHLGGATYETLICGAEMIAAEIARFATGRPLLNVFNRTALAA